MPSGPYCLRALGMPSRDRLIVLAASSGSLSAMVIAAAIIPPLHTWFQLLVLLTPPGTPFSGKLGLIPFSMSADFASSTVDFGSASPAQSSATDMASDI